MHKDKHKAPTQLRIRPLSLQSAGDTSVPMGMITLFGWHNSSGVLISSSMCIYSLVYLSYIS